MNENNDDVPSDAIVPTFGEDAAPATNPFAVNFLRMVVGLWADGFTDPVIQGIGKADALALTTEITGKTYEQQDFAAALADLDVCRDRMRAARQRIGL